MKRFGPALAWLMVAMLAILAVLGARAAGRDVSVLARTTPKRTALMQARIAEAARRGRTLAIRQRVVPYDRISPMLRRAVLVAEDDAFFSHGGLDWNELRASARRNWEAGRIVRGGSTITQQLAKNLWLSNARSPLRKIEEVLLAYRLERALTKRRIFELYLNVIEWGDGVFGAEAAARHYFGVSAAALDARQSVLLAAVIINPRRFSALDPPRRIERRARLIAGRLHRRGYLSDAEYRRAIAAPPEPWFGAVDSANAAGPEPSVAPSPGPEAPPADSVPGSAR